VDDGPLPDIRTHTVAEMAVGVVGVKAGV
jgi:hypothetical protein